MRRHREVLIHLARRATAGIKLQDFLHEVAVRASEAMEIDHIKILRYRADHGDLLVEAGVGWSPGIVGSVAFPIDLTSPPGFAFQTGQPVSIASLDEDPKFRRSPVLRDHGILSLINVPILVEGAAWGVVEADSTILRGFSADTEQFMVAVGSLIGMALRNDRAERANAAAIAKAGDESRKRQLLLQEMQHRMKNNFQTILALIAAASRAESRSISDMTRKLAESVMAMSMAHDQLSLTSSGEALDLATYLRTLTRNIQKPHERIVIEVEANEILITIEQAVPLGLIVNEAVTNAVKHAFDDESAGKIHITLTNADRTMAVLTIADNGRGLETKPQNKNGSGQRLIDALARQLGGKLERETIPGDGTIVRMTFPRNEDLSRIDRS